MHLKTGKYYKMQVMKIWFGLDNKDLMTCLKGNSEFCFPEILDVLQGEANGNIEDRVVTKLAVSRWASH